MRNQAYPTATKLVSMVTVLAFSGTALGETHWIKANSETVQKANITQWGLELDSYDLPTDLVGVNDQGDILFYSQYDQKESAWVANSLSDISLLNLFLSSSVSEIRGLPKWLKSIFSHCGEIVLGALVVIGLISGPGEKMSCEPGCVLVNNPIAVVCVCEDEKALEMRCPRSCEKTETSNSKTCSCSKNIIKGDNSDHEITRPVTSPYGTTIHPK